MKKKTTDIIFFSTANWNNPTWTNKQHTALALNKLGVRIFYIESVGLRKPFCTRKDLSRIWKRLKTLFHPVHKIKEGIYVYSPFTIPLQRFSIIRKLNSYSLNLCLHILLFLYGFNKNILWTYNPLTTVLLTGLHCKKIVYHCVDNISEQPGMPHNIIEEAELDLIKKADIIFPTSRHLENHCKKNNPKTFYFSNVADYKFFNRALQPKTAIAHELKNIAHPLIGFIGALSNYKVDFKLIHTIAKQRPDWNIVLIGEIGKGCPWCDTQLLTGIPNIHLLGYQPYQRLPEFLKNFDVAILPMARNKYTDSMFPMKFYEYLAAGLPIVSTRLPALAEFKHLISFANSSEKFIQAINLNLNDSEKKLSERLKEAQKHTYKSRTVAMIDLLKEMNILS